MDENENVAYEKWKCFGKNFLFLISKYHFLFAVYFFEIITILQIFGWKFIASLFADVFTWNI